MIDSIRTGDTGGYENKKPIQKFRLADILIPGALLKTGKIERNEENLALLEKTKQAQIDVLKLKPNRKAFVNHYINI